MSTHVFARERATARIAQFLEVAGTCSFDHDRLGYYPQCASISVSGPLIVENCSFVSGNPRCKPVTSHLLSRHLVPPNATWLAFALQRFATLQVTELMAGKELVIEEITPEQLEREIRRLDWRDLQLWCIGLLVLVVVAAGFLSLVIPQVLWKVRSVLAQDPDAPQLVFGLIMLLVLLNVYLFQQRRILLRTRQRLITQLQIAERTARTDALTGVYNRRFMRETLTREMARADRNQSKLCVTIVDVDDFKEFNTRYGHLAGDRILVDVCALLQRNFRAADFITRFGGDEFVVVMPETDLQQAGIAIERLEGLLERWNGAANREFTIGLSCGSAAYITGTTIEELLSAADADLYVQKALRRGNDLEALSKGNSSSLADNRTQTGTRRKARILL